MGYYWIGGLGGTAYGFLLDQGSYTTLDVPGATGFLGFDISGTQANGINDSGHIVGYYTDAQGQSHGFLLDNGSYTTLDVPGSFVTEAWGINASGQIVGDYWDGAAYKSHGFLYQNGRYAILSLTYAFDTEVENRSRTTEFRMPLPPFDWHPTRRHLRQFAWGTALFLAVVSWPAGESGWAVWLRLAAAFVFAVGTVLPGVLRWPYVTVLFGLYLVARLLGRVLRISPRAMEKRHPGQQSERVQEHHDRHSATGTHG